MTVKEFFVSFEANIDSFLHHYLPQKGLSIYNEASFQHELGFYLRTCCSDAQDYSIELERNIAFFGISYDEDDICFSKLRQDIRFQHLSDDELRTVCFQQMKHEIDICVYKGKVTDDDFEGYAIELKYPSVKYFLNEQKELVKRSNGAVPKQMYSFLQDLKFMEVLAHKKIFCKTFCCALIDSEGLSQSNRFYQYSSLWKQHPIYEYFRVLDGKTKGIQGTICYHKKNLEDLKLLYFDSSNPYYVQWKLWKNVQGNEIGRYYCFEINK